MFFDQKTTVHVLSGAGVIVVVSLLWRYRTSLPSAGSIWPSGWGGGGRGVTPRDSQNKTE